MNLALDEVLLDSLESGRAGETLRFWESPTPFVVLGVSQVLAEHADEAACAAAFQDALIKFKEVSAKKLSDATGGLNIPGLI